MSIFMLFAYLWNVWDMCGTSVGVCAFVGEQHSKPSKSLRFPFSCTRNIQQPVPVPIVVYLLFLCLKRGGSIRTCPSLRRAVAHWSGNRKLGDKWVMWEYRNDTILFTHQSKGYEAKRQLGTLRQSVLCRCISSYSVCWLISIDPFHTSGFLEVEVVIVGWNSMAVNMRIHEIYFSCPHFLN